MDCELVQRNIVPTEAELLEMYRAEPADRLDYGIHENVAWGVARQYLIENLSNLDSVHLLDVGCHTGRFLASLPERFQRFGIEAQGAPATVAHGTNGVELIAERVETVPTDLMGRFDVVTMFDVLEHLPDPKLGILSAVRLLKPGGLLIFSTGDADAWTWKCLGPDHWYLQTAQHLAVLSRSYIRRLAAQQDWAIAKIQTIAHTHGSHRRRLHEAIQLLHWAARGKPGLWRLWRRFLQELPACSAIRHKQTVPWTMTLQDHMFVGIRVGT